MAICTGFGLMLSQVTASVTVIGSGMFPNSSTRTGLASVRCTPRALPMAWITLPSAMVQRAASTSGSG